LNFKKFRKNKTNKTRNHLKPPNPNQKKQDKTMQRHFSGLRPKSLRPRTRRIPARSWARNRIHPYRFGRTSSNARENDISACWRCCNRTAGSKLGSFVPPHGSAAGRGRGRGRSCCCRSPPVHTHAPAYPRQACSWSGLPCAGPEKDIPLIVITCLF
jgi:hypothetical protein